MKIATGSDWRDALPFETPLLASDAVPGDPARCAGCGADAESLPRTELWVVKHRHPKQHSGYVRFYCAFHKPEAPRPVVAAAPVKPARAPRRTAERAPAAPRRSTAAVERPRAVCPDCFVEVAANGVCGLCGNQVG